MEMRSAPNIFSFLSIFVLCAAYGGYAADLATECTEDFQKVMDCLNFAQGKEATPTAKCCASVKSIKEDDPQCLCYFIQQMQSGGDAVKSLGLQEAKLLQLPSACQLKNASVSDCPKLLGLSPSSPDAAIFTNISSIATPATPTTSTTSGTQSTSSGTHHGPYLVGPAVLVALVAIFFFHQLVVPASSF